ncbi:MAG: alpha/beta fold hydrolase [Streptosporangiales bacterium]|nr:alpha/beta fold hydrolase [Streptosporangiales bacterium]
MNGIVRTGDGVTLRYTDTCSGRPVVLIHGWSQSAVLWRYQTEHLSTRYRVIAYDQRGHGTSDKPTHGYKIHRLAHDLHELLTALDLNNVTLVAHSMGCSVTFAYLELFGNHRLAKIALLDPAPFLTTNPTWTQQTRAQAGSLFTPDEVTHTYNTLNTATRDPTHTRSIIDTMLTPTADPELRDWIIQQNHKMPGPQAAALLYNHAHQDWRDLIPRITFPTLLIAGAASINPLTTSKWISQQIPRAQLRIIEKHDRGSHFAFLENPTHVNTLLNDFID